MGKVFSIDFKIVRPEEALIPVMDRGFLYGDSVYEAIRTYLKTIPFLLDRHYERLLRSAARIKLKIPFSLEQLRSHVEECAKKAENPDSYIRIVVSRGEDSKFDLGPRPELVSRTIILVDHIHTYPKSYFDDGINIAMVSVRRNLRTAIDPNIKSGNYLNNMLALMEARERSAVDAVMLNFEDCVTEATTSNVFMVRNGTVFTPEVESGLLEGISRGLLKEIMRREEVAFTERKIPRDFFLAADEMFLTGTTKEIMPVTRVDGKPVGTGKPGETTRRLMVLFKREVKRLLKS